MKPSTKEKIRKGLKNISQGIKKYGNALSEKYEAEQKQKKKKKPGSIWIGDEKIG